MLNHALKLAQQLLANGESETDIARGLLRYLSGRFPTETMEATYSIPSFRVVCQNTIIHNEE
jgi:hypothetical protein